MDLEALQKLRYDEYEVSWTEISDKIKLYTPDDCRFKFNSLLKEYDVDKHVHKKKDIKLIKKYFTRGLI